jgi:hypothetical protein
MTAQRWLEELLATDLADAGCDGTFDLLDLYVQAQLSGRDTERFRGVIAHLRGCAPCREDHAGLLAAARGQPQRGEA